MLEHVKLIQKSDNYLPLFGLRNSVIIENQPTNYKLCFLPEERLFNLIVEFELNCPCCICYALCQAPAYRVDQVRRTSAAIFTVDSHPDKMTAFLR